ncbi:MAG: riboflavin synthase [Kiritimatiellaeota bacterium]|nr:riboflavin synthase [Kiritimatiellota bacterium]
MFTGLVEGTGRLTGRRRTGAAGKLRVDTALPLEDVRPGESIAVAGACLTVEQVFPARRVLEFHTLAETLDRTNLGARPIGALLNLERALRLGDRLGGHLVSGHVDAAAPVLDVGQKGDDIVLRIRLPAELAELLIPKGSIAVEGVSLTVARLIDEAFECRIIPHTWEATSLHELRPGDPANLEADMVGKYILRRQALSRRSGGVTAERLSRAGFE